MGQVVEKGLVNQPTPAPTNKMVAVGVSGALTVVLVYTLSEFGINMPVEVASAITTLLAFGAGYMTKNRAA